ncbi:fatty acid-binding protein DegV [Vagococcus penaei]|uniref:Fatty acid-binding protein DegV n=1 Tax=Vagococcus penaei TaxID=633807 RepID=A0A1Q2D366_9ENTE|nr:DegV family protein [Vagococcus penaei]AQP52795.1 fatty acid-binding protein DegV [Vagococcus penaei]RSU01134.1 fatty acid-binding protein DegV [Vagococcus penaei]
MKTAIITDSTVFLTENYKKRDNLFVIPVPLIMDNRVYLEGVDIHPDGFYDLLKDADELPKTSQPAIGEVLDFYESLAKEGYEAIISIHMSSGISGFVTTLQTLVNELSDIKVYPFDSLITSGPMGKLVEMALDMTAIGLEPEKIVHALSQAREFIEGYIVVDDLNHLVRGGRLKNGAAVIGTLLKIKPILSFQDGNIVLTEKIRSQKKALNRVREIVLNDISSLPQDSTFYVIHCNNRDVAQQVMDELLLEDASLDVHLCDFGPVIGAHLGEKSIAIGVAPKTIKGLI